MEPWVMGIEKVTDFNFLNEEVENFTNRWLLEALVTWSKKSLNVVYEV